MLLRTRLFEPLEQLGCQRRPQTVRSAIIYTDAVSLCSLAFCTVSLEDLVRDIVVLKGVGEGEAAETGADDEDWDGHGCWFVRRLGVVVGTKGNVEWMKS